MLSGCLGTRAGTRSAGTIGGRRGGGGVDADIALGRTLDRQAEAGFGLRDDLELGLAVKDPDLTDILLGHMAQATDQRDQPFGIGVVLPADRHAEPLRANAAGAVARRGAGLAHGIVGGSPARLGRRDQLAGIACIIEQVLRLRQPLTVHANEGRGDGLGRTVSQDAASQDQVFLRRGLREDRVVQQALLVLGADLVGQRRAGPAGVDAG